MGLNLLLLVVGLVICFGGIYIRKVCSAILGLIWGALLLFRSHLNDCRPLGH